MLIDLLSPANYIMINRNAINTLGLNTAVYCSELLTIYKKVVTKKKFVNDNKFFKIDRKYIENQTTLNSKDQIECDIALEKANIVKRDQLDSDVIYFDVEAFSSLLACEDIKILKEIKSTVSSKSAVKKTKEEAIIQRVKESIKCADYDILMALRDWVDSMWSKRPLNNIQVSLFKETLENYCKGDKDKTLAIIKIASLKQYIDCKWAINCYEENSKSSSAPRVASRIPTYSTTPQKQTQKVGNEVF